MILLDAHAGLRWLHTPDRLSPAAREQFEAGAQDSALAVSAISVWEIALKHQAGKLSLPMRIDAWLAAARAYPGLAIAPITADIALESVQLPAPLHRDPADRLIVATARLEAATLVTRDRALLQYAPVRTVW